MLAPLANYGGPTHTMPPLAGSPAIDAGLNALALDANYNPLTIDQRGYPRIYNGTVDIGAVEFQPTAINLTPGNDEVTLEQSADHSSIDWTMGTKSGQFPIADPAGAIVNGSGGSDAIVLDWTYGSPLPNILHLNGNFTINGLVGSNPLANTNLEIGKSTVYISYANPSSDPLTAIQGYLQTGYNNGLWTGTPTPTTGVITSSAAAAIVNQTTAIGYADSADGIIAGQPANTVELKYTLYGDTGLTGTVGFTDFMRLTQHYTSTAGTWDTGDFNYDGTVGSSDFILLSRTYGQSIASAALPSVPATNITQSPITKSSTSVADTSVKHKRQVTTHALSEKVRR